MRPISSTTSDAGVGCSAMFAERSKTRPLLGMDGDRGCRLQAVGIPFLFVFTRRFKSGRPWNSKQALQRQSSVFLEDPKLKCLSIGRDQQVQVESRQKARKEQG